MELKLFERQDLKIERTRIRRFPTNCAVCSDSAIYSYAGAIVCSSCKVFFKRNSQNTNKQYKCHYDDDCEINLNTRHVCANCRLKKCFQVGMQIDRLRRSSTKINRETVQLPVVLHSNQITMTTDHWRTLSNIVNSYDENGNTAIAIKYLKSQQNLPLKIRFKIEPYFELWQSLVDGSRSLFTRNSDFLNLTRHDQSLLLTRNLNHTTSLASTLAIHQAKLLDEPGFYNTVVAIYGTGPVEEGYRTRRLMDSDITFMKLALAILMFSTHDPTYFTNKNLNLFENVQSITRIQNIYVEITWRYLLHNYNFNHAVRVFSKIVQCFLIGINCLATAAENSQFQTIIDEISETMKESLGIDK